MGFPVGGSGATIFAMTGTSERTAGTPPEGQSAEDHEAQLVQNLNEAIDAKNTANDQELEDMADGK